MRVAVALCGLLSVGVLSSCTSDDDTTLDFGTATSPSQTTAVRPTTTSAVPGSTTSTSSTLPAGPSTTAVAPTTVPPTDPFTTNAESTTVVSEETTTTPPPTTPEDQVKADYLLARDARAVCSVDPPSCDYSAVAVAGSPAESAVRSTVQTLVAENIRPIPGHGEVQIKIESVTITGDTASLVVCNLDSVVLYNVGDQANPDDDVVVNDEVLSYRVMWAMRVSAGRWLPYDSQKVEEASEGVDLCGFA